MMNESKMKMMMKDSDDFPKFPGMDYFPQVRFVNLPGIFGDETSRATWNLFFFS